MFFAVHRFTAKKGLLRRKTRILNAIVRFFISIKKALFRAPIHQTALQFLMRLFHDTADRFVRHDIRIAGADIGQKLDIALGSLDG